MFTCRLTVDVCVMHFIIGGGGKNNRKKVDLF